MDEQSIARHQMVIRLRRVEGQIRGLQKMIESGEDCTVVAQQLTAARKALDKAFFEMMACAMQEACLKADTETTLHERLASLKDLLVKLG